MGKAWRRFVLALLVSSFCAGTTVRKLVGGAPAVDPLDVDSLQSGTGLVDVTVAGLGTARGLHTAEVDKWLGIPFAHPPIGNQRWEKPVLLTTWLAPANSVSQPTVERSGRMDYSHLGGDPMNATTFLPSCFSVVTGGSWIRSEPESEDCLSLNVFAPAGHVERSATGHAELLPVVVYIHGGGFILGSGSNPSTSPPPDHFVISSDVIFVTFNYRLGPFSFISNAGMENYGGMLGIWDQVVALQWVNEYIHAFGGDSSKITLMGESAGAISICAHLVLPASRGLFQKAIMESALCGFPFDGPASARKTMLKLAEALDCAVDASDPQQAAKVKTARVGTNTSGAVFRNRTESAPLHGLFNSMSKPFHRARSVWNELVHVALSPLNAPEPEIGEDSTAKSHFEFFRNFASSGFAVLQALGNQLGAVLSPDEAQELDNMGAKDGKWNIHTHGRFQHVNDIPEEKDPYAIPALTEDEIAADHLMLQCMRSKTSEEVRNALQVRRGFMFYTGESFFPVINGIDIADHPMRLIEQGQWAKDVEILYGHNKDEASIFLLFAYPFLMTENLVKEFLEATVGEAHARALWQYYITGVDTSLHLRTRVVRMLNDMWACSAHYFAAHVVEHGGKIRYFQFQHEPSYLSSLLKWLGSFHGVELDFVFGVHQSGASAPTREEVHLSHEMMRLWAEFATSKRKALIPDSRVDGGWIIADVDSMYPQGLAADDVSFVHMDDWPLYDNKTQACINLQLHPLGVDGDCRPSHCYLWEATLERGLMRVPPQTPEPYISVLANVWGPTAVQFISKYLAIAIISILLVSLIVLMKIVQWGIRALRRRQKNLS